MSNYSSNRQQQRPQQQQLPPSQGGLLAEVSEGGMTDASNNTDTDPLLYRRSFINSSPRHNSLSSDNISYIWSKKQLQRESALERRSLRSSWNIGNSIRSQRSSGGGPTTTINEQTPLKTTTTNNDKDEDNNGIQEVDKEDDGDDDDSARRSVTEFQAISEMILGKGIVSACLLAIPLSLWAIYFQWNDTWIFWLNFIVMVPLASILGDFTEEVALHTNEVTGGLINASFGNAVEVVVAIQALLANEIRVVQASMLGSIFSNLLLVLGCCFFFGGIIYKEQTFNGTAATANMGLLALSSIALVLPTPFAEYYDLHDEHVLVVSRFAAIFLVFMYAQLLVFQLRTHAHIFDDDGGGGGNGGNNAEDGGAEELAVISFSTSCTGLVIVTLMVAFFSEFLVASIEGFTEASGFSRSFVGLILLPIIGNAVEHISAISVARKNKMDLAMGIAVGSCTQISLFVVPLTVLCGWGFGKPMTLNFPHFEVVLYVLSVFTVSVVCSSSKCNWLVGSLLVTTYCLIAVGFWYENVRELS